MALRNPIVIGSPDVFPSHAGAIPFYIGNNPHANGRWNTAGGLRHRSGRPRAHRARAAARRTWRHTGRARSRDRRGADAARVRSYIREQPGAWLALEATKLWYTIGNHRFVRDYDVHGENELIGAVHQFGLPFGVLLGARRARPVRAARRGAAPARRARAAARACGSCWSASWSPCSPPTCSCSRRRRTASRCAFRSRSSRARRCSRSGRRVRRAPASRVGGLRARAGTRRGAVRSGLRAAPVRRRPTDIRPLLQHGGGRRSDRSHRRCRGALRACGAAQSARADVQLSRRAPCVRAGRAAKPARCSIACSPRVICRRRCAAPPNDSAACCACRRPQQPWCSPP